MLIGQNHIENPFTELEVHFRGESLIERQAKMRQRAKELAEKRESERLKIVNEKNEQQWRQECVGKLTHIYDSYYMTHMLDSYA